MSYKAAWEAIETMNNLSTSNRSKRNRWAWRWRYNIDTLWKNLVNTYEILQNEQKKKFLQNLTSITDINTGTLKTIRRLSMQISARNQISGAVELISKREQLMQKFI